jgi:K+:H+ antiporter
MSLQTADIAHIFIALALIVAVAHTVGHLFALLRQPPVIGEIIGGLLLGPSVLGLVWPEVAGDLFPADGPTAAVLGAIYQLGLVFMMFLSGGELRTAGSASERRTVLVVTVTGLVIPFCAGLALARLFDPAPLSGPHGSGATFGMVFAIAIAVTSIPVISRIMLDLGLLGTPFARVVLSVAVLEDIALYVMLAVALGLAQANTAEGFGLWELTGVTSMTWTATYHVAVSVVFLAVFLGYGRRFFQWAVRHRLNALERRSPTAFRVVFLLLVVLVCVGLGINAVFGALAAGYSAAPAAADEDRSWQAIKQFSLAFFIPAYFALVGLQLDIVHHFPIGFFLVFALLACALKLISVWLGARLAGEPPRASLNLAVAMNARGGPGIVLATVTLSAGIINLQFFTVLVLLSIFTSQAAGIWLDREFSAPGKTVGQGRTGDQDAPTAESAPVRRP